MDLDNPAARLLRILEKGKKLPPPMSCRQAWCELLEVEIEDKVTLMGRLGKLIPLTAEITEQLSKLALQGRKI